MSRRLPSTGLAHSVAECRLNVQTAKSSHAADGWYAVALVLSRFVSRGDGSSCEFDNAPAVRNSSTGITETRRKLKWRCAFARRR